MLKVNLLAVLVSVVWQSVQTTYILDDVGSFGILDNAKLDTYHGPIFQSDLPVHFDSHDGIVLPHVQSQGFHFINQPINSFHHVRESSGFRGIPDTKHSLPVQHDSFPKFEQNGQQEYQNQKFSQQVIEVKSSNTGYSAPQTSNQPSYHNTQAQEKNLSPLIFNQHVLHGNDYFGNIGQFQVHKQISETPQFFKTVQSNIRDLSQQKVINVDFQQTSHPKPVQKANSDSYEADGKKDNRPDNYEDQEQKSYQSQEIKSEKQNNNHHIPNYTVQNNEKVYPVIYNQSPLLPTQYVRLHEGHIGGYTEIPSNFGSTDAIYRELHGGVTYQQELNSNGPVRLDHRTPVLISENLHGSLGDHGEILIGLKNDAGHASLHGSIPYFLLESNVSHIGENIFPNYPEDKIHSYNINLEQKPVLSEAKSEPEQTNTYSNSDDNSAEYKGIGSIDAQKDSNNGKIDLSYNNEQKTLEVGYKENSGQIKSYESAKTDEDKYVEQKNDNTPKYSDVRKPEYKVEQKTIVSPVKVQYDGIGSSEKYPPLKSSETGNTQQKSVDIDFKSDEGKSDYKSLGDSDSEYPGIGSIDAPKYPADNVKRSEQKVEQKSVETETYREVKAAFKSTGSFGKLGSSHKLSSDYISSAINNIKKDADAKPLEDKIPTYVQGKLGENVHHQYPSGGSSTSFFNSGHSFSTNNNNYNGRRHNHFTHSNSANHLRPKNSENSYTNSNPRQESGNHFTSGHYRSHGSNTNPHRPTSTISNVYSQTSNSGNNYQKPISSSFPLKVGSNRYLDHQSTYGGIAKAPTLSEFPSASTGSQIPSYHDKILSRIPTQKYVESSEPYNSEKFVKITYEYPRNSLRKDDPIYASSVKPSSDYRGNYADSNTHKSSHPTSSGHPVSRPHFLSSSRSNSHAPVLSLDYLKANYNEPSGSRLSYVDSDNKDSSVSNTDYSNGIGGLEYPGIGEKSSSIAPETVSRDYSAKKDTQTPVTEQKTYEPEESLPTYSDTKSEINKPSGEEYKRIGEIGTIPSAKSEIVGGRHPIRRPIKSSSTKTKSNPSGVKGRKEDKIEQKYLPITAALADSKPVSKQYGTSTKTKAPEKIEQQQLSYEAFLSGEGPQNNPGASSGYGFNKPDGANSSPSHASSGNDEHFEPMPYEFHFDIQDDEHGSEQYRREKMDDNGYLTGSYGFKDGEGIFREVEYEASKEGFKVNSIKTNEPGTDNEDPADVHIEVQKQR